MIWRSILTWFAVLGILCLCFAPKIQAADITLVPELDVRTEWNDNVDMGRSDERSDIIATLTPSVSVQAETERFSLNSRVGLGLMRYAHEEERNTEYLRLSANARHWAYERLQFSANAGITEDEALQTELEETGLIVRGVDRRRYNGGAGCLYDLTPYSTLGLDGSRQRTEYSGEGYVDSTQDSLSLTYRRTLSDQVNGILFQPYYSRYDSERSQTDNYGLSAGWTRSWTQTLTSQAVLGVRHTRTQYSVLQQNAVFDPTLLPAFPYRFTVDELKLEESNWGGVADISMSMKGESHSLSAGYKRDLGFSAEGQAIVEDRLYWSVNRAFSERLSAGFSTALSHSESEGERSRTDDWYFQMTPSLSWRITRDHVLTAGYGYSRSWDEASTDDRSARRHRIWAGVTMRFPRKW
ncbi:MAG: outer membrane beta-barrel protein [Deltaproteobacteria bacterium]|nr:outer membrane beta-barrel protein [Deltaproteobacteria bacterium]